MQDTQLRVTVGGERLVEGGDAVADARVGRKTSRVSVSVNGNLVKLTPDPSGSAAAAPKATGGKKAVWDPLKAPPGFQVVYKPSDMPDFIVPASYAVRRMKEVTSGDRICMDFDGKPYYGKVLGVGGSKKSLVRDELQVAPMDDDDDDEPSLSPIHTHDDTVFEVSEASEASAKKSYANAGG